MLLFAASTGFAQNIELNINSRASDENLPFNSTLEPFYHGVASGDPLPDAVVIWTRITPTADQPIDVDWEMATDTAFANIIASGMYTTDIDRDYTVKLDVAGLNAATTYYYRFSALGGTSITGRTRTAPAGNSEHLKFAVASCNNYQSGYFSAFGRLAERNDIDAVLHLGDFIYEYQTGGYGYTEEVGRGHQPDHEILGLSDYRIRYSYYRLDDDLRRAMQQHPFILIWDDHEVANDAWLNGANNHTDNEGDYADRKSAATQALFEWVPIRDNATQTVYRSFSYGNMADVIMLDTRHEARAEQVDTLEDPTLTDPDRYLLGPEQMQWFKDGLTNSTATWKVVGNQIVFAQLFVEELDAAFFDGARHLFLDTWYGYPTKREEVINHIVDNDIDNIVFLTGDVHISLSFDVSTAPRDTLVYNAESGMGSIAVEAVTPSISSDNYDELFGAGVASVLASVFPQYNPHNKFIEVIQHGYIVLDLTDEKAQMDYYYLDNGMATPNSTESFFTGFYTNVNENYLNPTDIPAPPKATQQIPAPDPTADMTISTTIPNADILLLSVYPNPYYASVTLHYALAQTQNVRIALYDATGKLVKTLHNDRQIAGNYDLRFAASDLASGMYFLHLNTENGGVVRQLIKE